ncbi:MAG: ABC transporter permease [Candidatus Dormibacteraceae bacterium]
MLGAGQGALRTFYLICRREFITRVRTRIFLAGTVVLMVLLVGYILLQGLVFNRSTATVNVGFTGNAQVLAQALRAAAGAESLKVATHTVKNVAGGQAQVLDGTLDLLVSGDSNAPDVAVKDSLDPIVGATLTGIVRQLALDQSITSSGGDVAAVQAKVASAKINIVYLDPNAPMRTQRTVVGIFVAALLYVALLIYGQIVAAGVVEEKANRIIEILLSTVRPRQVLLGKVVGIGLMGFLQLLLLGIVALVAGTLTGSIDVPTVGVTAVLGGLLWFVLGFVFFALIYAAGGSLVSRQEDLAAVTAPISMLIVGTYLAFFWVVANPDNPLATLLSIIPPFAPILMPARMATGDAAAWQVLVAVVLTIAAIAALNTLAARIYSNSVLKVGSRVRLLEAWRGAH